MYSSMLVQCVTPMLLLFPAPREPETSDKGWGFLGLSYVDEVQGQSIRVSDVYDDTPAHRAGLKGEDIITALNGKPILNTDSFTKTIVRTRPSTVVELDVIREGKPIKLKVKLGTRPESFPHPFPELEERR
jgi:S1-C subfamily serine protease